ncbi:MAG: type III-B CRISPR module RAMP protein Cmr4, partial [Deltaproteobacteria bacterium]|nr:type III-B CRISPR module RAMP protein Cmr4 [Deltaproteobacteria bacterium]
MFPNDLCQICILYCLSPLHAGAGQAIGPVDLPIQRERHTGWPQVQASGVKGAFRDWFLRYYTALGKDCLNKGIQAEELTKRVFGREEETPIEAGDKQGGQAGAVSVSDARLLAFPVRSDVAPFVWVTCPAILTRLSRDMKLCLPDQDLPPVTPKGPNTYIALLGGNKPQIILEDLVVTPEAGAEETKSSVDLFRRFAPNVDRLLLITDEDFSFLVRTATEIQPQIRIDHETGTTVDGSLRYQELLPSDSVLY